MAFVMGVDGLDIIKDAVILGIKDRALAEVAAVEMACQFYQQAQVHVLLLIMEPESGVLGKYKFNAALKGKRVKLFLCCGNIRTTQYLCPNNWVSLVSNEVSEHISHQR